MAAFTTLALALAAGSAATSVIGSIKAGNAAKRTGEAQREAAESGAELADYNAQVAALQAQDAIARGAEEESNFRVGVRGLVGSQRTGFAAGGIDVGYGSAVDVQADTAYMGELDALTIRGNARREAWGFEVQSEDLHRRAAIARKEGVMLEAAGQAAQGASRWGAATTLLGTGASMVQARYGFSSRGGRATAPRLEGRYSGMPTPIPGTS